MLLMEHGSFGLLLKVKISSSKNYDLIFHSAASDEIKIVNFQYHNLMYRHSFVTAETFVRELRSWPYTFSHITWYSLRKERPPNGR